MKLWELFGNKKEEILEDFRRDGGVKGIKALSSKLAENMIALEHCMGTRCVTHWKKDKINPWLNTIKDHTFVKTKSGRLTREDLIQAAWNSSLGSYKKYLTRYDVVTTKEHELKFSAPSEEALQSLKRKYLKAFDIILQHKDKDVDIMDFYDML